MTIRQGTILPTTGIGTGYLLLFIYGIIGWNIGFQELLKIPSAYILIIIPAIMQFSYKDFIVYEANPEVFKIRYRFLFFIPIIFPKSFDNFDTYVIRVINKSYNVMQSGTAGMTTGKNHEGYYAIIGRDKKTKKVFEICKGKKAELDQIIKTFIQTKNIPVYKGAPKSGYEYIPK